MASVLVVDDEPSLREMLRIVLRRDGYDVEVAASGEEAIARLTERPFEEPFDVLVCDVRIGDVSGFEVLRAALNANPNILGFMMTAFASSEGEDEAMRLGAADYLAKPFSMDELRLKLRQYLEAIRADSTEDESQSLGLHKDHAGHLYPAPGWEWVAPDDPESLAVRQVAHRKQHLGGATAPPASRPPVNGLLFTSFGTEESTPLTTWEPTEWQSWFILVGLGAVNWVAFDRGALALQAFAVFLDVAYAIWIIRLSRGRWSEHWASMKRAYAEQFLGRGSGFWLGMAITFLLVLAYQEAGDVTISGRVGALYVLGGGAIGEWLRVRLAVFRQDLTADERRRARLAAMKDQFRQIITHEPWYPTFWATIGGVACALPFYFWQRDAAPSHYVDGPIEAMVFGGLYGFAACLFVRANPPIEHWWRALRNISLVSAVLAFRLGTHVEDPDYLGRGLVTEDFDPTAIEYTLEFARSVAVLTWGTAIGAIAGPKQR